MLKKTKKSNAKVKTRAKVNFIFKSNAKVNV
jgi:hypothetical protein